MLEESRGDVSNDSQSGEEVALVDEPLEKLESSQEEMISAEERRGEEEGEEEGEGEEEEEEEEGEEEGERTGEK